MTNHEPRDTQTRENTLRTTATRSEREIQQVVGRVNDKRCGIEQVDSLVTHAFLFRPKLPIWRQFKRKCRWRVENSPLFDSFAMSKSSSSPSSGFSWIRGVNIGGWLLLERFISPYLFSLTECHVQGNLCWYPGQIGAPPMHSEEYVECDYTKCKPLLLPYDETNTSKLDFPADQYTLMQQFQGDNATAAKFLDYHYDFMVTRQDIVLLKQSNITHVRVPIPHWILGDIAGDEPYVHDSAWLYFTRLVHWCRQEGIEVWPDLHTAPGSQNGFDNSGHLLRAGATCKHWSSSPKNVARTLKIVDEICRQLVQDDLTDVVTGFGILNEPFLDCDLAVVRDYNEQAIGRVKSILGESTSVYVADSFNSTIWNDGSYLANTPNTYLDSHYYHVFAEKPRALSPRQHIAFVCQKNSRDTQSCCYTDPPHNEHAINRTRGVSRIIGEWSASFDTLVGSKLDSVMKGIANTGVAPELHRNVSQLRQDFLKSYVEAQMVTYEATTKDVSSGWFYWTLKTEGGAFAEWDFSRGLRNGWIPSMPARDVSSESVYGSCYDLMLDTNDDMSIVHEYPDPNIEPTWEGPDIDDDVVLTHGESVRTGVSNGSDGNGRVSGQDSDDATQTSDETAEQGSSAAGGRIGVFSLLAICFFSWAIRRVFCANYNPLKRSQYSEVGSSAAVTMAV